MLFVVIYTRFSIALLCSSSVEVTSMELPKAWPEASCIRRSDVVPALFPTSAQCVIVGFCSRGLLILRLWTLLLAIALLFFRRFQVVLAQNNETAAACITATGYGWANNSIGQDPCTVAHDLFAADPPPCNDFYFPTLSASDSYPPPGPTDSNSCLCNTVIFSLASACDLCRGADIVSWSDWIADCPSNETLYQQWPASIAPITEIPPWAYMALVNDNWDGPQAKANASAVAAQRALAASPSPSPSSAKSKSTGNAGAIAGGVVGGVAAGTILIFLSVFFWRRHQQASIFQQTFRAETGELPH
ncbi:hypothetical protein BJ138DRAFT_1168573 [Hygrophoropsis aurantiaca]|uniref:Uncharacterized protein n=1 Tax=Hygrophoropsis aurantiaca TaxID=72124 RepID=A0ACB7ZQY9_9AGAM|nr:hypothetical protein BJ138DRAFT_1168573 [Hygrophoropsis aurantiaca]